MKFNSALAAASLGLLFVCGCYNYPAAPKAVMSSSFTHREKDKSDDLFKDMQSLTLADAQRIALQNNPDYISAAFAINAARANTIRLWEPTRRKSRRTSRSRTATAGRPTWSMPMTTVLPASIAVRTASSPKPVSAPACCSLTDLPVSSNGWRQNGT